MNPLVEGKENHPQKELTQAEKDEEDSKRRKQIL